MPRSASALIGIIISPSLFLRIFNVSVCVLRPRLKMERKKKEKKRSEVGYRAPYYDEATTDKYGNPTASFFSFLFLRTKNMYTRRIKSNGRRHRRTRKTNGKEVFRSSLIVK